MVHHIEESVQVEGNFSLLDHFKSQPVPCGTDLWHTSHHSQGFSQDVQLNDRSLSQKLRDSEDALERTHFTFQKGA